MKTGVGGDGTFACHLPRLGAEGETRLHPLDRLTGSRETATLNVKQKQLTRTPCAEKKRVGELF